jgi:anaerobic selenocysteine-containing dehydrogenase
MATETRTSFCRVCYNYCPILVDVTDGRVTRVQGDRENDVWAGHTCIKGRMQHERLNHPDRLLNSLKRRPDGTFAQIEVDRAIEEIANQLQRIVADHGPNAVAYYWGTAALTHVAMAPLASAFMAALGSPMVFNPVTIDKPGKQIARALHGDWQAPGQAFDNPQVALLIGNNPLVTYQGAPIGNPGWIAERMKAGMKLIVIDPRRTEVARRATIYLQVRPGTDAAVLASMLREIIQHRLYDVDFYSQNIRGIDELWEAVEPFTAPIVSAWADVPAADLTAAARTFASASRGYAFAGTGPNMSGLGTLNEYLVLCLESLCGHWLRQGEVVRDAPTLAPTPLYRAQPRSPQPARDPGLQFRVRGLTRTVAGLPTAAVADEILLDGDGQIRALISCAGNPVSAWPDHAKVVRAMRKLDLLVQIDPWMTQTAQLAHYVIAPKMSLEVADASQYVDILAMHYTGYGPAESHAQYTPAVVDPPEGSNLIEEWEFFYRLAQQMKLELSLESWPGGAFPTTESPEDGEAMAPVPAEEPELSTQLDMLKPLSKDQLLAILTRNSRVPLAEVKRHIHGKRFPHPEVRVAPRDPKCEDRLDVGNPDMMAVLTGVAEQVKSGGGTILRPDEFRLINRRMREMYNSWVNDGATTHGRRHNPAYMHPGDMESLGLQAGDRIKITSDHGAIAGIVEPDETLRRGLVSMTHGFGSVSQPFALREGSNVAELVADDTDFDPYSGQPRMSDISVQVARLAETAD